MANHEDNTLSPSWHWLRKADFENTAHTISAYSIVSDEDGSHRSSKDDTNACKEHDFRSVRWKLFCWKLNVGSAKPQAIPGMNNKRIGSMINIRVDNIRCLLRANASRHIRLDGVILLTTHCSERYHAALFNIHSDGFPIHPCCCAKQFDERWRYNSPG